VTLDRIGEWFLPVAYRATVRVVDAVVRFENYLDRWIEVLEL